jgi:hypothetical protein
MISAEAASDTEVSQAWAQHGDDPSRACILRRIPSFVPALKILSRGFARGFLLQQPRELLVVEYDRVGLVFLAIAPRGVPRLIDWLFD